jgi:hypothetical protein
LENALKSDPILVVRNPEEGSFKEWAYICDRALQEVKKLGVSYRISAQDFRKEVPRSSPAQDSPLVPQAEREYDEERTRNLLGLSSPPSLLPFASSQPILWPTQADQTQAAAQEVLGGVPGAEQLIAVVAEMGQSMRLQKQQHEQALLEQKRVFQEQQRQGMAMFMQKVKEKLAPTLFHGQDPPGTNTVAAAAGAQVTVNPL